MTEGNLAPKVLLIEDDEAIITLIRYNLEKENYNITVATDGEEALIAVKESEPDIILLDWMLPSLTGIEICRILRKNPETKNIPIIMLSAKGEELDRVEGLENGVDDYMTKPFSPKELIARIKAVFRRSRPVFVEETIEFSNIKMNTVTKTVYISEKKVELGPTGYKILQALLENPKRVLSRENLIKKVWDDYSEVDIRTIDVHINRLRKSISNFGNGVVAIKTVRSEGYCLKDTSIDDI